jgi:hypothetical protein
MLIDYSNIPRFDAGFQYQNSPGANINSPHSANPHSEVQSQGHNGQLEDQYVFGAGGQNGSHIPRLRDLRPNVQQTFNGVQAGNMYSIGHHHQTTSPYMINGRVNPNVLAQGNPYQSHQQPTQANSQISSPAFWNNLMYPPSGQRAPLTPQQQEYLRSLTSVGNNQTPQQFWANAHQQYNQFNHSSLDRTLGSQFQQLASAAPTILRPPVLPAIYRPESAGSNGTAMPFRSSNTGLSRPVLAHVYRPESAGSIDNAMPFRSSNSGLIHPVFSDTEDEEQDLEVNVLTSFHLFPKLPADVRLQIFNFALLNLPPRYIHLVTLAHTPSTISFFVSTPPQPLQRSCSIRQICQQARNMIPDPDIQIMNIQDCRGITTPILFHPSKDIIVFSHSQGLDVLQAFYQIIGPSTASQIQKICKINEGFNIHEWNNGTRTWSGKSELSKIFIMFPALKVLQLLPVTVVDRLDGGGKEGLEDVLEWKWKGRGFCLREGLIEGVKKMALRYAMLAYRDAWDHWRIGFAGTSGDYEMLMQMEMPAVRLVELVRDDDL